MRPLFALILFIAITSCRDLLVSQDATDVLTQDFLRGFPALTDDSLVNVVVEIPAGTNEKWEVDKTDGSLQWERITADSMRIIPYLPYPANYGMVPRTLLPAEQGGDGDPLDVFLLGPTVERGAVVVARVVGVIQMRDHGEQDDKLIAVSTAHWFGHVESLNQLQTEFPGVVEALTNWLANYKGEGVVQIVAIADEEYARSVLLHAVNAFEAD